MGCNLDFMSNQRLTNTKRWLRERRSQRIDLTVPVVVHRPPKEGTQFNERAQTLVVNAHGALMALVEKVTPKQRLLMQNIDTGEQKECRVVYVEKELAGPTKGCSGIHTARTGLLAHRVSAHRLGCQQLGS